jgi:hypothetical protein
MAMTETVLAIYLYGFTLSEVIEPKVLGVDNSHAVSTHRYADLNAIISPVALADFTGEVGEDNLQNVAWLTPRACRHALVIDKTMLSGSVYPVPFGTLFSNLQALEQEMQRRTTEVTTVLKHITGCEEWAVEASLERKQAVDALFSQGLQSGRFVLPDSVGRRHLEEQKLRRTLNNELNAWLVDCLSTLQSELMALAYDFRERRLSEEKVLHWAFLLPVEQVSAFQAQVADLTECYASYGFNFRVTGPWAAYSFCR